MTTRPKFSPSIKKLSSIFRSSYIDSQTLQLIGVFIVLVIFFAAIDSKFLSSQSITSMGFQLPELGVLSLAMMLTIITGGINLSVNATSNLAAVLAGFFMLKVVPPDAAGLQMVFYIGVALWIALLVGRITGIVNGFLIGYIGVNPILATLATMTFFTGISTGLTGGATVTGFPEPLAIIGHDTLLAIPIPFIVFVLLNSLTHYLLYRTAFGFKARMLGSNPVASEFSAIENRKVLMQTYVLSGILSAVTGILTMSRTMSAAIEYGTTTYVLLTILISVLANVISGFGNVINVFISIIILQILSTGFHMILAGIRGSSFFKDFAWGVLLILIFIVNYFVHRRESS